MGYHDRLVPSYGFLNFKIRNLRIEVQSHEIWAQKKLPVLAISGLVRVFDIWEGLIVLNSINPALNARYVHYIRSIIAC